MNGAPMKRSIEKVPLMQAAAPNSSGKRHVTASALKAPIEAPAAMIGAAPGESRWMAGTTSAAIACWYWLNSHCRCSGDASWATIAIPAALSHE